MDARRRLDGLDLFRGLAVAAMILVNSPGSGEHVWWPLDHAAWHGWTPTDLIFPAFLFAVGVALGLAFPVRADRALWLRIARRSLLLVALGWAIQILARPDIAHFRFFGVLPRIGLCYALAASLALLTARRGEDGLNHLRPAAIAFAAFGALILYWALLTFVAVPGHGAGVLSPEGNLAGYIDRTLFTTAHIWRFGTDAAGNVVYDPEGLLSTLPALANVLFGILAAAAWRYAPDRAPGWIAIAGVILVIAGLLLDPIFPINKRLWTSSYALFTTGTSALLLILCTLAGGGKWLAPLRVFGMNAITGYVLSLLLIIFAMKLGLIAPAFAAIQSVVGDPYWASFLFALAIVAIVLAALVPLHRRGIHLRL